MKKNRKKPREQQTALKESLEKRLAVYALAAGAAGMVGVGALAFPPPAEAAIFTTTNFATVPSSFGHPFFFGYSFKTSNGAVATLAVFPILGFSANNTSLLAGTATGGFPDVMVGSGSVLGAASIPKLGPGAPIGPTGAFATYGILEGRTSKGSLVGNWTGTGAGYIGLDFFGAFFGWALVSNSATAKGGFNINLIEAAIDTAPHQSIKAGQTVVPEPPTLALLALGAVGLFALRKKRQAAAERESAANG